MAWIWDAFYHDRVGFDASSSGRAILVVEGDSRNNTLRGSGEDDRIYGFAGRDTIKGLNGDDVLFGGVGNDRLDGNVGDDRLFGNADDDSLRGGAGDDWLYGNTGDDKLVGGDGRDSLYGNAGNDYIVGQGGSNVLSGGSGRDLIYGDRGADTLYGGDGNDSLLAQGGDNKVYGGNGNDHLSGRAGADELFGGKGRDKLSGYSGNDNLYGGEGDDKLFSTINTTIKGGAGDDRAYGVGAYGRATVDMGSGDDIVYVGGNVQVRLTFTSAEVGNGSATESRTIAGQDGGLAVRMQDEDYSGTLTGPTSRCDDEGITFYIGTDTLFDVRDISGATSGENFNAVKLGTSGKDIVLFNTSVWNYYINGGADSDIIETGSGDDFLVGGRGSDSLAAGEGIDTLLGGAGADRFYFNTNDTGRLSVGKADTIADFGESDRIVLEGTYTFTGDMSAPDAGEYSISQRGSDFVLTYNASGRLHDILVMGADPTGDVFFA